MWTFCMVILYWLLSSIPFHDTRHSSLIINIESYLSFEPYIRQKMPYRWRKNALYKAQKCPPYMVQTSYCAEIPKVLPTTIKEP